MPKNTRVILHFKFLNIFKKQWHGKCPISIAKTRILSYLIPYVLTAGLFYGFLGHGILDSAYYSIHANFYLVQGLRKGLEVETSGVRVGWVGKTWIASMLTTLSLLKQGKSREQVNEYLSKTPLDKIKAQNLKADSKKK